MLGDFYKKREVIKSMKKIKNKWIQSYAGFPDWHS
jgi:hypothetical protein